PEALESLYRELGEELGLKLVDLAPHASGADRGHGVAAALRGPRRPRARGGARTPARGPGLDRYDGAPVRLLLARHGESEWNRVRRFQGANDVGLSDVGRAQAEALGCAVKRGYR